MGIMEEHKVYVNVLGGVEEECTGCTALDLLMDSHACLDWRASWEILDNKLPMILSAGGSYILH
jgi:hypothetical protein